MENWAPPSRGDFCRSLPAEECAQRGDVAKDHWTCPAPENRADCGITACSTRCPSRRSSAAPDRGGLDHRDVGRRNRRMALNRGDKLRRPCSAAVGVVVEVAGAGVVDDPVARVMPGREPRSEEHTSELQSLAYLVCRLLL